MDKNKIQNKTLMWFARICGVVISAVWMYQLIQIIVKTGFRSLHAQASSGIILFLLISTLFLGVLLAWIRPLLGGRFIIILSVLLGIFLYFSNLEDRFIPLLYQAMPFFLVGLLFVQSQAKKEEDI